MKSVQWILGVLVFAVVLSGCRGNPLTTYVDEIVPLKRSSSTSSVTAFGMLTLTQTVFRTVYRQSCDEVVCGYDTVRSCSPSTTTCEPTTTLGGEGSVCRTDAGSCTTTEYPRYCKRNCRWNPEAERTEGVVTSAIAVQFEGLKDSKAIQAVSLGLRTNEAYQAALRDSAQQPEEFRFLFESLKPEHKTLVLLMAKGYALAPDQDVRSILPEKFAGGDSVSIHLRVVPATANVGKATYSAIGLTGNIPAKWILDLQTSGDFGPGPSSR